ncbi:MAG: histidinol dehydrogenase [Anaerolineaceae bacterium]|nr:histidinol dehydrogenase [Anaerolineaceae bacterium]
MLRQYSKDDAQKAILRRGLVTDVKVPQRLLDSIEAMFGEALTPEEVVNRILADVRENGDAAVIRWTEQIDGVARPDYRVNSGEMDNALKGIDESLREALVLAIGRVRVFHQKQPLSSWITNELGGTLGQLIRPIRRVGIYIPAGTAPLPSTVLMTAIPAQVAGVKEIVLVSPPERSTGKVNQGILAAAALLGINEVYAVGGAQAIAMLAYGTESVERVDKIFGPGNIFVTIAKQKVFGAVGIDNLAGPTETMVIADENANPAWVAADLLAQAEHDVMASAILLTPSQALIQAVQVEVAKQMEERGRAETIAVSLENRSGAILTDDLNEAVDIANRYAAEHLCLAVRDPWKLSERIECAGGIFMGEHSFEVLGDYVAGPSHAMPTGGSARFSSPINVLDFIKVVSLVALDENTVREIAPAAAVIADAEGLDAHANSARVRL